MFEEIYKKPEYYLMNDFQNVQRNCTVAYDIHIANHTVSFGQEPDAWRLITTMSTPKRKKKAVLNSTLLQQNLKEASSTSLFGEKSFSR